jgi:hypothetical protein
MGIFQVLFDVSEPRMHPRRVPRAKYNLIRVAVNSNMGYHIVKTTIEIADDLFEKAQRMARKQKTSLRALTEAGLRLVLSGKHLQRPRELPPLVTFGGDGPMEEFKDWNWERVRDEVYRGRGT